MKLPGNLRGRLAAGATVLALAAIGLYVETRPGPDPTRVGPERTLTLGELSVESLPGGGFRLRGEGRTNLPDDVRVAVEVSTTEIVLATTGACLEGRLSLDARSTGAVTNGAYMVVARLRLEDQTPRVREVLHYQPRELIAQSRLIVKNAVDADQTFRARLRALIRDANGLNKIETAKTIDDSAAALERELWLSTLTPAVKKLRRALEAYVREAPRGDIERLRREVVGAEVLSSF